MPKMINRAIYATVVRKIQELLEDNNRGDTDVINYCRDEGGRKVEHAFSVLQNTKRVTYTEFCFDTEHDAEEAYSAFLDYFKQNGLGEFHDIQIALYDKVFEEVARSPQGYALRETSVEEDQGRIRPARLGLALECSRRSLCRRSAGAVRRVEA